MIVGAARILALRASDGPAFDRAFLAQQATTAEETAEVCATYRASGTNADLRRYADALAPAVEAHRRALAVAPTGSGVG